MTSHPSRRFQIVVVGSGFAGSLTAMVARRLGFSVALIERGKHPRFAIGESSTPLANLLLEQIASDYDLRAVQPLCKWGSWQRSLPHLGCGLKRGFTFYHHTLGQPFAPERSRERQLMVGASPCDAVADTHWYRPHFDTYLVEQAQTLGVEYWDEVNLTSVSSEPKGMRLEGDRRGASVQFDAEFVIDATGPRGFLHRMLGLPEKALVSMPPTQALFAHFREVAPLPICFSEGQQPSEGLQFSEGRAPASPQCRPAADSQELVPPKAEVSPKPPYPEEAAAVHHVFDGGWVWVLKFNHGISSAGVAATDPVAKAFDFGRGEPAWRKLLSELPSLQESFRSARAVTPFIHQPRIAFQSGQINGSNWVLLPSAAGVVDPLLSTGFPLTLLGIARLGRVLKLHWRKDSFREALDEYARQTTAELEATARLVGAVYATMSRFELFKALSLMYFVAASFSETAHRVGKPQLAEGFLLCENGEFSALLRRSCDAACKVLSAKQAAELEGEIRQGLEPFDVAGLTDRTRDPWYPARPEDVLASARKLGASQEEVRVMLRKCGMAPIIGNPIRRKSAARNPENVL